MKRKGALELSDGPTPHRMQHTPFTRDVLTPPGAPIVARHRARTILTPTAVRRAILEDIASKPAGARLRALRRRLTLLDRALSDRQAEMLERLVDCINGLSNIGCLNYLRSEIRASPFGRLPFGEAKRREIAAMARVLKELTPAHRQMVLQLARLLDPSQSVRSYKLEEEFVASVCAAADSVVFQYDMQFRRVIDPGRSG